MAGVTIVFADSSTLKLDATFSQAHERKAEVTDHAVEDGADVSDHIRPHPHELAISAIQSFAPIVAPGESPEANRHVAAFTRLERAVDKGELVTVETGLKVYADMAITGMTASKDPATGFDVPLKLSFRKVKKATAKTTAVPKDALGKANPNATGATARAQVKKTQAQAAPKVSKGPVAKQAATAQQTAKAKSVLLNILGGKLSL